MKVRHFLNRFLFLATTQVVIHSVGASIAATPFGTTSAGDKVTLLSLENAKGMKVAIIDYGATVVSLHDPDKNSKFDDVVIGYDNMPDYQERSHNFGSTVGRYASRITNATFVIEGATYSLPPNSGPHSVHGGPVGFDKVMWRIVQKVDGDEPSLKLKYISPDGDMGFPGELTTFVTYSLTIDNALRIDYEATTTKPTPINLTHHSYFNLKGDGIGNVLDHKLQINASHTPSAPNSVPTGEIESIEGTPLDFRSPSLIGERINHPDFASRRGYNHYYILDGDSGNLVRAATLSEATSGRTLEVWTTEPGLQLYTGNWLSEELVGKTGVPYQQYGGVCLEPEHYPDSPNQPHFPNTILQPKETFTSTTLYKFGARGITPVHEN
ncbi:Aldose 1-epimerase subfamily [Verrucomicrobiia bacterium DG1235]|nr:Aldose 1-epimerase subfamily [Verrucomicrobiae bacterium DG1235]